MQRGVAEIRGIDEDVRRHFSRRRMEIRERMAERGGTTARSAQAAALETRRRKDYDVPADRLRQQWRARAEEHGLGPAEVATVAGHAGPAPRRPDGRFLSSSAGVTREASTFDRRDVLREWAEAHAAGAPVAELERLADAWLASPDAVRLESTPEPPVGGHRYSTPEMLAVERRLVGDAIARQGQGAGAAIGEHVDAALAARPELSDEQVALVRGVTTSGDGVQVIRAAAGTGKTYALDAAREAWEASGCRVFGCALSARAAAELESKSGIDSTTIARLQMDLERGYGLVRENVLVVDEAGMVGSRALDRLAAHAREVGAKLVLVGDDHQLPEIDAGGGFRGLAERLGCLELQTTRRQTHEWDREALQSLRAGAVDAWASQYRERGRLVARPTARAVRDALVNDWWVGARGGDADAVMIAHRRSDVADLNARARELMRADGRLGEHELVVGDRAFAVGDRVLAKRNDRRLDVTNGVRGEVRTVDLDRRHVVVEFRGEQERTVDAAYLEQGHLEHGYALTAHAAQGATVDRAYVLGSDDLYREWGYTALTRHRDEARFYLVSAASTERSLPGLEHERDPLLDELEEMLAQSRRKGLAIDVVHDDTGLTKEPSSEELLFKWRSMTQRAARHADEAARIESAAVEAEARLAAIDDERREVGRLQRRRRAEVDERAAQYAEATAHWRSESALTREAASAAAADLDGWLAEHGDALHAALLSRVDSRQRADDHAIQEMRDRLADPSDSLVSEVGARPDGIFAREEWAHAALDNAVALDPLAEAPTFAPDVDFDLEP